MRTNVDPLTLTPSTTPGLMSLVTPFLENLSPASILDRWAGDGILRFPYASGAAVLVATRAGVGAAAAEGGPKGATEFALSASLVNAKGHVFVVISDEYAKTPNGTKVVEARLRVLLPAALNAAVTDVLFDNFVAQTPAASGTTATPVLNDLSAACAALRVRSTSSLYLIVSPDTASSLAFKPTTTGAPAFADMTPNGGTIQGVPTIVSDGLGQDALLVDARRLSFADGGTELRQASHASLAMTDDGAGAPNFSLWQRNCVGLLLERPFAIGASADTNSKPCVAITGAW